jgi:hypothetical protein
MPVETAPTTELGSVNPHQQGLVSWTTLVDDVEHVPDLQWPQSVVTYRRMLTDAQLKGLSRAVELPLSRRRYVINPNGASAESIEQLKKDISLPVKGEDDDEDRPRQRRRGRFSFTAHRDLALKALWYGHYFFEQVAELDETDFAHLKKLAPRAPRTIDEINVEKDGGLQSIRQMTGPFSPVIPVALIVAYVWEMEAGNWQGESMLRSCYRHWLVKDRLIRVDAINHERGGGVPIAKAPPGASKAQIQQMDALARSFRVTEYGGGAIPDGADLKYLTGKSSDVVRSINYHDEQMAGAFLAMFKQLGQTQTGSRALGETFTDFFSLALDAVAEWFLETFNLHVVEDWYDWNFPEDAQAAVVEVMPPENPELDVQDLKALIDAGAIKVDDDLENELRQRYRLPAAPEEEEEEETPPAPPPPAPPSPPPAEAEAGAKRRRSGSRLQGAVLPLPARDLRRQPYDHEIAAQVDFAAIDANLTGGIDQLVNEVKLLQRGQIDQLHDMIADAGGSLAKLAALEADPVSEEAIFSAMLRAGDMGIDQAVSEATRQGLSNVERPTLDAIESNIAARAAATDAMLARSLSETASRQALARTGGGLSAAEVADEVRDHLNSLTGRYLEDQLGGAVTQAMNSGRKIAIDKNDPEEIYASELLDANTCEECVALDGNQYESVADAEQDYPSGGYKDCLGGPRCRGTLVAVYPEERTEGATN